MERQVKKYGRKKKQQAEDEVYLVHQDHERALKGSYESFVIPALVKADIDRYVDQVKLHRKVLVKVQLKEMQSAKVIMMLWVRWIKPVKLAISVGPKDGRGMLRM